MAEMQVQNPISKENEAKLKTFIRNVKEVSGMGVSAPPTEMRFELPVRDTKEAFRCRKMIVDRVASSLGQISREDYATVAPVLLLQERHEKGLYMLNLNCVNMELPQRSRGFIPEAEASPAAALIAVQPEIAVAVGGVVVVAYILSKQMPNRFNEPQFVKNAKDWWMSRSGGLLPPYVLERGSSREQLIHAVGGSGSGTKMPDDERKTREKEYQKKKRRQMGADWKAELHNLSHAERNTFYQERFITQKDQITGMNLPNGRIDIPNIRFDIGRSLGPEEISQWFRYRRFNIKAEDVAYYIKTGDPSGILLMLLP